MQRLLAVAAMLLSFAMPAAAQDDFVAFEAGPVRPLALSADRTLLLATNTPDNRLEGFAVDAVGLQHLWSVPVGLEPVAVAMASPTRAWVVNHLSDSISIVALDSQPPRVVQTLQVGDEPRDIVFAGKGLQRAFITTARRGQHSPLAFAPFTPGLGRASVWVFDADVGTSAVGDPLTVMTLFADTPRALAATADGNTVYAAAFLSGNRSSSLTDRTVAGDLPPPSANVEGIAAPEEGLIVQMVDEQWVDAAGRDWSAQVSVTLPDRDLFAIDASAAMPTVRRAYRGVGTVLFNLAVNPADGTVYASNLEADNLTRFEGAGKLSGSTLRGRFVQNRISLVRDSAIAHRHLNKHIDYEQFPGTAAENAASLALPLAMAISADGATLYAAAFGSARIGVFATAELTADSFVPDESSHIALNGGGPAGLALDELRDRLYVYTRFDNAVAIVDTSSNSETARFALHNPEPAALQAGRPFLYDARYASSRGDSACGSCHIFGHFDGLAWDLGDPDATVTNNPNPFLPFADGFGDSDFHPMKGPMVTQSLRGMAQAGPMHWRGDRSGGSKPGGDPLDERAAFLTFNGAFETLLGRDDPLSEAEMNSFADFVLSLSYPPNPQRALDNTDSPSQARGRNFFRTHLVTAGEVTCNDCHSLAPLQGQFGTAGLSMVLGQPGKVPHLRNLYEKVGFFGISDSPGAIFPNTGNQVRGFGFGHLGAADTLINFLQNPRFDFPGGLQQRRDVANFLLVFDTDLAPIVGQQVTLTAHNAADVSERIDLFIAQAMVSSPRRACDLVVKGVIDGVQAGWRMLPDGRFQRDQAGQALLTVSALRALADSPGQELSFSCVPPGSGYRIGIDRDNDGVLDGDEAALL